jgi:hypothetical protein
MKNKIRKYTGLTCALVMGLVITHGLLALAGWTGSMNGDGYGKASVNVTSPEKSKTFTTTNMTRPSVSMTYNTNYVMGTSLPSGASLTTVSQVKGFAGYIWQAYTMGNNGDDTGNPDLAHIKVDASEICASLQLTSLMSISNSLTKSGAIEINAIGEAGTAFRARGYELVNGEVPPPDDPATEDVDEFKEFLKLYGDLKWDIAMSGPFAQGPCSTVTIPFTWQTDLTNLYFVADGTAKSVRMINCPQDIIVQCGQPVVYPDLVDLEAIDGVTLTYDPPLPPGGIFPMGAIPVTVTATHVNGCTAICAFNVINALDFNGFYPPISTYNAGTCEAPVRTVKLGNNLPVKFDVSCLGSPVTTGHPTMTIEKPKGACGSELVTIGGGEFQVVGNEWHFNWNTGSGGVTAGPHKLTTTLQDGIQKYIWVKLK